ncbi:MAG: hypothetical protein QOJ91_1246 [Sphingomonadales bacterium]|nr:hypothetical protein [Sphingomonadales bacterium]
MKCHAGLIAATLLCGCHASTPLTDAEGAEAKVARPTSEPAYIVWDRGKVGMPRLLDQTEIRTDNLAGLVEAMRRGSSSASWAALMLNTPDRPSDEDAVALQISFENGRLGFDWELLAPRNVEDQERFRTFARAQGLQPVARSLNGVSYLRVEGTDAARFTASVVTEMYHLPQDQPLALVYEGFEWPLR